MSMPDKATRRYAESRSACSAPASWTEAEASPHSSMRTRKDLPDLRGCHRPAILPSSRTAHCMGIGRPGVDPSS
jgi:hypothetical protein